MSLDYFYTEVLKTYLASYAVAFSIAHNPRYSVYERWFVINKMAFNLTLQYMGLYAFELLMYESGIGTWFNIGLVLRFMRYNLYITAMCYLWTFFLKSTDSPVMDGFIGDMVDMRRTLNITKNEGRGFTDRIYMGCEYTSGTDAAGFVRGMITTDIGQDVFQSFASKLVWVVELFVSEIMSEINPEEPFFDYLLQGIRLFSTIPVISHAVGCIQVLVSMVISFLVGFSPADYFFKEAMRKAYVPPTVDNLTEEQKKVQNFLSRGGQICSSGAWLNLVQNKVGHTKVSFVDDLVKYAAAAATVSEDNGAFIFAQDKNLKSWCRRYPTKCDLFNEDFILSLPGNAQFRSLKINANEVVKNALNEKFLIEDIDIEALELLGLEVGELQQLQSSGQTGTIPDDVFLRALGMNNYSVLSRIYNRATLVPSYNCASNSASVSHPCCASMPQSRSAIPDNGEIIYNYEVGARKETTRIARRFYL